MKLNSGMQGYMVRAAIEFHRVDLARSRDGAPLIRYNSRSAGRRKRSGRSQTRHFDMTPTDWTKTDGTMRSAVKNYPRNISFRIYDLILVT